jgi:hypothetical protein
LKRADHWFGRNNTKKRPSQLDRAGLRIEVRRFEALVSGMPKLQLPIFSEGIHLITPNLGYQREGEEIVYLHGTTLGEAREVPNDDNLWIFET